jgi:hypothetical protein
MTTTIHRVLHGPLWNELIDAVEACLQTMRLFSSEERRTVIFDDTSPNGLLRATVIRKEIGFTVSPWDGPWQAPDGFGYVRIFTDHRAEDIAQSIREQLATARCAIPAVECFACGCTFERRETRWLRFLPVDADETGGDEVSCEVFEHHVRGAVPVCGVCATAPWW